LSLNLRKKGIVLGIVIFGLGVIYSLASFLVYDKLSRVEAGYGEASGNVPTAFSFKEGKWQSFRTDPFQMRAYERVTFESRQKGIQLAGWFVPNKESHRVIIVVHGFNKSKADTKILLAGGMLWRNGFNILFVDLRDHGESDIEDGRTALGTAEYLDVLGAWDWLQSNRGFQPKKIGGFGGSLGAATVINAMGAEPEWVASFVDSPFSNLKDIIRSELTTHHYPRILSTGGIWMAKLVSGDDLLGISPEASVGKLGARRLYVVHAINDKTVDISHAKKLKSLTHGKGAEFWFVDEGNHVESITLFPKEYEERMAKFFAHHLSE
jgi:dipeptidyl aminopeptidase/acylaminoacyl peptidase